MKGIKRHAIITGGAGFIGSHLVDRLLGEGGWQVTVVDNFHPLYPKAVKESNIAKHAGDPRFTFIEGSILEDGLLEPALRKAPGSHTVLVHLAARVGVRPSITDPIAYHQVNVTGTLKLLELARLHQVAHFMLASSSSVYGEHPGTPWKETIDHLQPISPYAASKLAAEAYVKVYARLHGMDATVLRFFTVYGPRQRPDLAIHSFFRKVSEGVPIPQFGDGTTQRDYTYVGDIINGVRAAMDRPMQRRPGQGAYEVFNLGNSETIALRDLIAVVEEAAGRKAVIERRPAQPGDVPRTYADIAKARTLLGYSPQTRLIEGMQWFADWYRTQVGECRAVPGT